jgi:hypothetical protein
MDNFDLKKFLIENKMTRNSQLLNEAGGEEAQFKTKEGESLKAGEEYTYVGRIAKTPGTTTTDEDEVSNVKVSLNYCSSHTCYFKVLDPEFIGKGFKEITLNLLDKEPEKISKHIRKA